MFNKIKCMQKNKLSKIASGLNFTLMALVVVFLSACSKNPPPKNAGPIDPEFRSYFSFGKMGSYWVYRDPVVLNKDSVFVKDYISYSGIAEEGKGGSSKVISNDSIINPTLSFQSFSEVPFFLTGNMNDCSLKSDQFDLNIQKQSGQYSPVGNSAVKIIFLDTTLKGVPYTKCLKVSGLKSQVTTFYFGRNIGIIGFVRDDGHVFILEKYKINR